MAVNRLAAIWLGVLTFILAGCSQGAVVFAPTPPPPDFSPLMYRHPSGAFTLDVPRTWTVYEQDGDAFAGASFSPTDTDDLTLTAAVIRLETASEDAEALDVVNAYQQNARPARYTEQKRQRMEDGSWRLIGLMETPGGLPETRNTFIEYRNGYVGMIDITLPEAPDTQTIDDVTRIANTFRLNPEAELETTPITTLRRASRNALQITNVNTWRTQDGVYFITGEVTNNGDTLLGSVPVRVELRRDDGAALAEAYDTTMGYGIRPGDFAPFSLRFGQGQPPEARRFRLTLGGTDWEPDSTTPEAVARPEALDWSDDSTITEDGTLRIEGRLTNMSDSVLYNPVGVVTVFDARQNVIAASFAMLEDGRIAPEATVDFTIQVQEMGGQPANYILDIQARTEPPPESDDS